MPMPPLTWLQASSVALKMTSEGTASPVDRNWTHIELFWLRRPSPLRFREQVSRNTNTKNMLAPLARLVSNFSGEGSLACRKFRNEFPNNTDVRSHWLASDC